MYNERAMFKKLIRAIRKTLWGDIEDRIAEVLFPFLGLGSFLMRTTFLRSAVLDAKWELLATVTCAASAMVIWHAYRGAYAALKEVQQEEARSEPRYSPILSPSGTPWDEGLEPLYPFARTALFGMATCLAAVAIAAAYLSLRLPTWLSPASH